MPSHKLQKKQVQQQRVLRKNFKDDLLKWICEKHATNSPLDRKILRQKALQISQSLELINFKCSEQWITTFLKRYGFSTSLTSCAGPYFKDYRIWIDLMRPILTQYKYRDIFNVDELTMYSDVCPLKIQKNSQDENQDSINASNLISILLCCNSSGTDKLPLLITGQYKSTIARDDCKYYYNETSSINDEIFIDWIINLNQLMTENSRQILLLLHRHKICALGNTQLSNVKLLFFPTNFPPHLRPLRRDVFHSTKMNYRLNYAEKIFQGDAKWEFNEMLMAILQSWSQVPKELIVSSFQRTTFRSDDKLLEINNENWEKLNTGISFKKLVTFDDHLSDSNSMINNNEKKEINREKHKYNLRTSSHQVFQIDELGELSELKNECQESRTRDNSQQIDLITFPADKCLLNLPNNLPSNFQSNLLEKVEENLQNIPKYSKEETKMVQKEENIFQNREIEEKNLENLSKECQQDFSENLQRNLSSDLNEHYHEDFQMETLPIDSSQELEINNSKQLSKNSIIESDDLNEKTMKNFQENTNFEELKINVTNNLEENFPIDLQEDIGKNSKEDKSKNEGKNSGKIFEENKKLFLEENNFSNIVKDESKIIIEKMNKSASDLTIGREINSPMKIKMKSISLGANSVSKNHWQPREENSHVDINDDYNEPSTSEKRNHSPSHDDDEPPEKVQATSSHWSVKYEKYCAFGPNFQNHPGPSSSSSSSASRNDENYCNKKCETLGTQTSNSLDLDSDFTKSIKDKVETKEKSSGSSLIFTKSGTLNSHRSPKD